jgi:hypothetical protein
MKFPGIGFLIVLAVLSIVTDGIAQTDLQEIFCNPPDEAKPRGYWVWPHGNFDYARITEELEAFKEMGLGGVDIYDMGIADPYNIIPSGNPFMSEQMLDGIEFALKEAARLDLKIGFSVSNGWNAGGDWTTPDEMIMRLLFWTDSLQGPAEVFEIGFPDIPATFEKPYGSYSLFPQVDEDGFPVYYENVALVAYPLTRNSVINDQEDILYFDPEQIKGNQINIKLPDGNWVLARAVVTPLGQKMWMRSDRSNGWIMDHYSQKATKHHFEHIINKLEGRLGDLRKTALERLYLASFEAEDYIIWSPELKESFFNHHGYEIDPYIPVFTGLTIIDEETARRFLYDYRLTVSEMFVNNHYRQARDICNNHGVLLASESGGPGPPLHYVPTEDLKALGSVNIMRGEFWNREPEYFDEYGNDLTYVVKNIASAAHIYGHKIVEMEAFTSHNKHWQERPVELKKLADKAFCTGMTRVVYHTMPHSPKEAGVPGWSYQAGTHISPKMAWWELSKPFHDYLARVSALLQQGHFVADVAYYYGENIPNFATGAKYIRKTLGEGYDYDDLNKEILLQCTVTEDGQLLLPSGIKYKLLVLPDDSEMSLEVLQKIESLLQAGANILGPKPERVPGLKEYKIEEKELNALADKIWYKSKKKQKRNYGKGWIYSGYTERDILEGMGVNPDFLFIYPDGISVRLDYIHRATSSDDIYFIRNKDSADVQVTLDFRVNGKQPYLFDPVTGSISRIAMYLMKDGRTRLPVHMTSYGSTFIVFSGIPVDIRHISKLETDKQSFFQQNKSSGFDITFNDKDEFVIISAVAGNYKLTLNDGTLIELSSVGRKKNYVLDSTWDVYFPHGWGFEPIRKFDRLSDWTSHKDKELSIFSGIATYKTTFLMEKDDLDENRSSVLDLGLVGEVAKVYLNGKNVGSSVFPPHVFNIDGLLREGENNLVVDVANTWLNQLIGEKNKPYDHQRTRSNVGRGTRDKPVRHWNGYDPIPSGLIGPVRLIQNERIIIKSN